MTTCIQTRFNTPNQRKAMAAKERLAITQPRTFGFAVRKYFE